MSIKLRFSLLLGLLLAGLLLALVAQWRMEKGVTTELLAAHRQTRAQLLSHWIEFSSRALPQFTADLAQSDEIALQLARSDPDEPARTLGAALRRAGLSTLWLLRDDGTVALTASAELPPAALPPPLTPAEWVALTRETPAPRFFGAAGGEPLEVCVRRIQSAGAAAPRWLAVARRWDRAHLRGLEALCEARLTVHPPQAVLPGAEDGTAIVLQRPLPDWQGHPRFTLRLEAPAADLARTLAGDRQEAGLFLAFGVFLIAATALALHQWVVRPLGWISASLAGNDPAPLAPLDDDRTEFGRLARLARDSFAQQQALRAEIAQRTQAQTALERSETALRRNLQERDRLGRDLHDGVIQSLYATGMGLGGIRALLQPDQTEAASRLEQTRAALNETIHDVRNFIIGLEPEALKLQTFAQAVAAMLEVMRSHRDFHSQIAIDEAVASRLTLAQRVHALQITREAVSNALRHGGASQITVTLQRPGGLIEFEVTDNGSGFDPAVGLARGAGLANFQQRARELGAELTVHSEPGRGTRVKLAFSPVILL